MNKHAHKTTQEIIDELSPYSELKPIDFIGDPEKVDEVADLLEVYSIRLLEESQKMREIKKELEPGKNLSFDLISLLYKFK